MFEHRVFDVETTRNIGGYALAWPENPDADDLEANHYYEDLRNLGWADVERAIRLERSLIVEIERASTLDLGLLAVRRQLEAEAAKEESDIFLGPLWGLDLGTASLVAALSASGCIPFSSCNAGAFGGQHVSAYPVVGFFMQRAFANVLLECAARADVGVSPLGAGRVQAYGRRVVDLISLAECLLAMRSNAP